MRPGGRNAATAPCGQLGISALALSDRIFRLGVDRAKVGHSSDESATAALSRQTGDPAILPVPGQPYAGRSMKASPASDWRKTDDHGLPPL